MLIPIFSSPCWKFSAEIAPCPCRSTWVNKTCTHITLIKNKTGIPCRPWTRRDDANPSALGRAFRQLWPRYWHRSCLALSSRRKKKKRRRRRRRRRRKRRNGEYGERRKLTLQKHESVSSLFSSFLLCRFCLPSFAEAIFKVILSIFFFYHVFRLGGRGCYGVEVHGGLAAQGLAMGADLVQRIILGHAVVRVQKPIQIRQLDVAVAATVDTRTSKRRNRRRRRRKKERKKEEVEEKEKERKGTNEKEKTQN